jgi:hypothetical protein
MCWNAEVSLNTFLFSGFVLLLIIYNNNYTQYKIQFVKGVDNIWSYIFLFSFIVIQLIEFFIWKTINNPILNAFFSNLAFLIVLLQPMTSIIFLPKNMRMYVMLPYILFAILFFIHRYNLKRQTSSVTKLKHLSWGSFLNDEPLMTVIWLCFFLLPILYAGSIFGFIFTVLILIISLYNYYNDQSVGSMWCWLANTAMFYYAAYILFYLPFYK